MGVAEEDFQFIGTRALDSAGKARDAELDQAFQDSMANSGIIHTMGIPPEDYDGARVTSASLPEGVLSPQYLKPWRHNIGSHDAATGRSLLGSVDVAPEGDINAWTEAKDWLNDRLGEMAELTLEGAFQTAGIVTDVKANILNMAADIEQVYRDSMIAQGVELRERDPEYVESPIPPSRFTALNIGRELASYGAQYAANRAALVKSIGQAQSMYGKAATEMAAGAATDFMNDPRTGSLIDLVASTFAQEVAVVNAINPAKVYETDPMKGRGLMAAEGVVVGGLLGLAMEGASRLPAAIRRLEPYADDLEQIGVDRMRRSMHQMNQGVDPEGMRGMVEWMTAKILKGAKSVTPDMRESLRATGATGEQMEQAFVEASQVIEAGATKAEKSVEAWHGSPHEFDQPSLHAVGTGEGRQAFGYGFYSAESRGVAESYKKSVSAPIDKPPRRTFQGNELEPGTPEYHAATLVQTSPKQIRSIRKEVQGWIDDWAEKGRPMEIGTVQGWQKTLDILNQAESKKDFGIMPDESYLYRLQIPKSDVDNYLDWDAPLSEQPEAIRGKLKKWGNFPDKMKGGAIYQTIGQRLDQPPFDSSVPVLSRPKTSKRAMQALQEIGIPGIKYYDASSRGAGEGTRNFVTFDPDRIRVISRNGKELRKNEKKRAEVLAALGAAGASMQVYEDDSL